MIHKFCRFNFVNLIYLDECPSMFECFFVISYAMLFIRPGDRGSKIDGAPKLLGPRRVPRMS